MLVALVGVGAPEGLDALAADDSLIPSPEVERARALRAEAAEAEAALGRLAGVQQVRVVRGERGVHAVVRHDPGPPPASDADVRQLVAAAIGGRQPADVHVVFSEGPPPAKAPPERSPLVPALAVACAALGLWAARRSVARA